MINGSLEYRKARHFLNTVDGGIEKEGNKKSIKHRADLLTE
jgi:hypothetical protein